MTVFAFYYNYPGYYIQLAEVLVGNIIRLLGNGNIFFFK